MADSETSNSAFWECVGDLWAQATGGSDVAARPASFNSGWPTANRPPGVSEAMAWFKSELAAPGLPKYLFLVGGPGAGKSHAAAELVDGLQELERRSPELAYRTYQYTTGTRGLLLVNDATIQSEHHRSAALSLDIEDVVADGRDLLACINRGILVEEASEHDPGNSDAAGLVTVRWLHGVASNDSEFSTVGWGVETDESKSYLRAGRLVHGDQQIAQLLAVFVDVCSLFESTPALRIEQVDLGQFDIEAGDYAVQRFTTRSAQSTQMSAASSLFREVVAKVGIQPSTLELVDPISANIQSLTSPSVQTGIQSVLRGAEIAASQRLTYRELWGAVARCIVGDLTDRVNADNVLAYVSKNQPRSSDRLERFRDFQKLASVRFSQALFGAEGEFEGDGVRVRNPVTRLTRQVDPTRDCVPGNVSSDANRGWATPISDAFAGHVDSGSPLEQLVNSIAQGDPFRLAVTDFDRQLDAAFADVTKSDDLRDRERYRLIAWYGAYLTRLYAVSNGIPAFRREISAWTLAWYMSPKLPGDLEDQLLALLKPARFPEGGDFDSLIPIFESRTNPIVGDTLIPKLALRARDIGMTTKTDSDSLFLELEEAGRLIPPIVLDLPLMREALACGAGHAGVTDLSDITSPRLERFRAARLVPGNQLDVNNFRLVNGLRDEPLTVGKF